MPNVSKILYIAFLLCLFILADVLIGLIRATNTVRESATQFRAEAAHICLRTKRLVPSIEHIYQVEGRPGNPRRFRTDDAGFIQGPEILDQTNSYTILFLGGSTTETNEVDEEYRFPYLASKHLAAISDRNVVGLNYGVRGHTTVDSINLLNNQPKLADAQHVVLMHNINDRLLLSTIGSYDAIWLCDPPGTLDAVGSSLRGFWHASWDYVSSRSNFLFLLNSVIRDSWTGQRKGVVDERAIEFAMPAPDDHLRQFESRMRVFVNTVLTIGKSVSLMTQPLGISSAQQNAFNDVIRKVAKSTDAILIDLDAAFPEDREYLFLSDSIHLNNQGSELAAEIISEQLSKELFGANQTSTGHFTDDGIDFERCSFPTSAFLQKPIPSIQATHRLLRMEGRYPVVSPNGKHIVFQSWNESRSTIWLYERATKHFRRITPRDHGISDRHPIPLLNSEWIIFGRRVSKEFPETLFRMRVGDGAIEPIEIPGVSSSSIPATDRTGKIYFAGIDDKASPGTPPDLYQFTPSENATQKLTNTSWEEWRPAPSPTARYIYHIANPEGQFDIFRLDSKSGQIELVYGSEQDEWDPTVSSDGRWLAFASKQDGDWDLYMLDLENLNARPISLASSSDDYWDPRFVPGTGALVFAGAGEFRGPATYWMCPFGETSSN